MRHEIHSSYHYCKFCDYFSRKSNALSMHLAMKHSKHHPHKCPTCPKRFPTKTQMTQHVLSQHTRSVISCEYPGCEEKFKTKYGQRIHHMRKHTDLDDFIAPFEKEWECVECGKTGEKGAILYHVASCSPYSPFTTTGQFLCQEIQTEEDSPDIFCQEKPADDSDMEIDMLLEEFQNVPPTHNIPINVKDDMLASNVLDLDLDLDLYF